MRPDKKTCCVKLSLSLTEPLLDAAKNADKRASRKGTAHGSAKWSVLPERPSSRNTTKAQSWAPRNNQAVCCASRSADSTAKVRHCCHSAADANTASSATLSMAMSKAAPVC